MLCYISSFYRALHVDTLSLVEVSCTNKNEYKPSTFLKSVAQIITILGRFQFHSELLEFCHEVLHSREGVGEAMITKFNHCLLNPLKEICRQSVVVFLQALNVHHNTNHLTYN